jgi:O-antigen ligase
MRFSNIWESDPTWKSPGILWWSGVLTLVLYAGFAILLPSIGSPAETLCALLGLGAVLAYGRNIRNSGPLWLLLAALTVQTVSWSLAVWHHPDWAASNPKLDRLAKLFIFIAIAWFLGGSTRNTLLIWGLAFVGWLIATFAYGNGLEEWWAGLHGKRAGLGYRNAQHGSMLFGAALLGLIAFSGRFSRVQGRLVPWRIAVSLVLIGISLVGISIGQTRAVWLGLTPAISVAATIWLIRALLRSRNKPTHLARQLIVFASGLLVVSMAVSVLFQGTLQHRLSQESPVVQKIIEGDVSAIPYSSIGIRIHSWRAALEWIEERPLVGWGSEGRGLVMDHTSWLPSEIKEQFGHLHNYFLEVWVAYGLLGVCVIAALAFWVGRGTWLAWRGGVVSNDLALFAVTFFVYWLTVNQFESYNAFSSGVYVQNLVLGGLVTHIWRWQNISGQRVFRHRWSRQK